jgi:uncharacterized protein YcaQ
MVDKYVELPDPAAPSTKHPAERAPYTRAAGDKPNAPFMLLKIDPNSEDETLSNIRVIIHQFWDQFLPAYAEYGPRAADELGLAGQWGDLHRKVKKLKAPLWEGDKDRLTRETPRQVLYDIIGHALLAIDMIDRGLQDGR